MALTTLTDNWPIAFRSQQPTNAAAMSRADTKESTLDVPPPTTAQKLAAEFLGTFVLVLGGCGSAVLAAGFMSGDVHMGIGFAGVALAFGLTVVVMAYAVGHVSGGHFNPAVTLGLAAAKRFAWKDTGAYIVTQVVGAIAAAAVLYVIANGQEGFSAKASGFATNGYGDRSPGQSRCWPAW